jgi:hypothetical protein
MEENELIFEHGDYKVNVDSLQEFIKKTPDKQEWCVFSEKGKGMGCYPSKKQADERLHDVEMFKHMKEAEVKKWSKDGAASWVKSHDFKTGNVEKMKNYWSFRQTDPEQYETFRFDKAPFNGKESDGVVVVYGIKGTGKDRKSEIQTIRFYHGGGVKEEMVNFRNYIVEQLGMVSEQIDIETGIEKVLRALLVDQFGVSKADATKIVSAGFDKASVMEVMNQIGLADKLKADYLKLIAQWKNDINFASHNDLEFLMKESENMMTIMEAMNKEGTVWKVAVIEKGKSYNKTVYQDKALEDMEKIINEADAKGAPIKCNAFKFEDTLNHLPENARKFIKGFVENIVGWYKNAKVIGKQLIAELHLDEGADKIQSLLMTAMKKGIKMPFGLSIDGEGDMQETIDGGQKLLNVIGVKFLNSIDCVTYPSAGGKFLSLVESYLQEENAVYKNLIEAIGRSYPELIKDADLSKADIEMAKSILSEASKKNELFKMSLTEQNVSDVIKKVTDIELSIKEKLQMGTELDEAKKVIESELKALKEEMAKEKLALEKERCGMILSKLLGDSKLPATFKEQIKEEFKDRIFTETDLQKKISAMETAVSEFNKGSKAVVDVITSDRDKAMDYIQEGMDILCGVGKEGAKDCFGGSIKRAYQQITGDETIDGTVGMNVRRSRISEAIVSGDFPYILANSQTKVLVREYNVGEPLYRKIAKIRPLNDFKVQDRVSFGEFANLATVLEGAPFTEFVTPSEERAIYTAGKKGNYCGISREALINDDLGKFTRLMQAMGRAALRTLNQYTFDKLLNFVTAAINDGTIYDGKALYHADHNNITSDALSVSSLDAAMVKMWNHKDMDAKQELGIVPKYLILPRALKALEVRILDSQLIPTDTFKTYNDVNPVYKACEPMVSPFLRGDANNWYLLADPMVWDGLELGFVLGKETPTLIAANQEAVGAMFTNDVIQYKVRHEYGAGTIDYRPFFAGIVA